MELKEKRRLDRWLRQDYPRLSQGVLEKLLRQKVIRVNGQRASASQPVGSEDQITVRVNLDLYREQPTEALPNWTTHWNWLQTHILYEDSDLLILNKPSGLAVQGGSGLTLHLDGILKSVGEKKGIQYRLVHRLDRWTSGVWVVAKTLTSAQFLACCFRENRIQKTYHAIIEGRLPQHQGQISIPIGKVKPGTQETVGSNPKPALTHYQVLQTLSKGQYVALFPQTGRMHQLRIHMAKGAGPIWGDEVYGSCHPEDSLHLHALDIEIPLSKPLIIRAPLPHYFLAKIETPPVA
jgi:23S rRNA pseudouridine955/2504/2580 synthase